jgi:hypothetical protein
VIAELDPGDCKPATALEYRSGSTREPQMPAPVTRQYV